jgi:hypothetical protein
MTRLRLVLCILAIPISASARARPGIEVGGSRVWLSEDFEDPDTQPGARADFNAAATLTSEYSPTWSFVTGLRYSRLGNEVDLDNLRKATDPAGQGIPATRTVRQQYLGVPLLARWRMPGDAAPFLFVGGEVAWLLKASIDYDADPGFESGIPGSGEFDITDDLEDLNLVLVVGAGVDVHVGEHAINVALRSGHGINDPTESGFTDGRTREVAATVGFLW